MWIGFFIDGPMEESDLRYIIQIQVQVWLPHLPVDLFILSHLRTLILVVLSSAELSWSLGFPVIIGWMEMPLLFRHSRVLQHSALQRLSVSTSL